MRSIWVLLALAGCAGLDDPKGELVVYASQPTHLAVSGGELFYVSAGTSQYRLYRESVSLPVATADVIYAVAADLTRVYWVESGGKVMALDASGPVELGASTNGINGYTLRNLVTDGSYTYFADISGAVWRSATNGGGTTQIGTTDTSAGAVAVGATGVWVATLHGAKLIPFDGGTATELTFGSGLPDALAWDAGTLFAAYAGSGGEDGKIVRVADNGDTTTLADGLVLPTTLASGGGSLYTLTGNLDASVRRVPHAGGGSEAIAIGWRPAGLALDSQYVYWSDSYEGYVRRVPR